MHASKQFGTCLEVITQLSPGITNVLYYNFWIIIFFNKSIYKIVLCQIRSNWTVTALLAHECMGYFWLEI